MNPIFYLVIKIIIDFKIQFPVKILTFLLIDLIFSKEFQELYYSIFAWSWYKFPSMSNGRMLRAEKLSNILPNHENKMPKPRLIYNFQIFNFRKIFKLWLTHILLKVHTLKIIKCTFFNFLRKWLFIESFMQQPKSKPYSRFFCIFAQLMHSPKNIYEQNYYYYYIRRHY